MPKPEISRLNPTRRISQIPAKPKLASKTLDDTTTTITNPEPSTAQDKQKQSPCVKAEGHTPPKYTLSRGSNTMNVKPSSCETSVEIQPSYHPLTLPDNEDHKINSCAGNPDELLTLTHHDHPPIQSPKIMHGTPTSDNDEERLWKPRVTPTKATSTQNMYGLPKDITKPQTNPHLDLNPHLTPKPTTNPCALQKISHIRTSISLDNAGNRNIADDVTDTTMRPESGNPSYPKYLPVPFESDSKPKIHSNSSKMDINEYPSKATFTSENHGLPGGDKKVRPDQHNDHSLDVTHTTSPHPLHENSDNKPKLHLTPSKMDIDETPPMAAFTSKNYGLPRGNTKAQPDTHDEHYLHVTRTTNPRPVRPVHGNSHIQKNKQSPTG